MTANFFHFDIELCNLVLKRYVFHIQTNSLGGSRERKIMAPFLESTHEQT